MSEAAPGIFFLPGDARFRAWRLLSPHCHAEWGSEPPALLTHGTVLAGDRLVKVNGERVIGKTYSQVIALIQNR